MKKNAVLKPAAITFSVLIGLAAFLNVSATGAHAGQALDYGDYAAVLASYVNSQGMVDYESLKADRKKLDAFGTAMATLDPKVYEAWTEKEKIAFWINAYNALTLNAIINHYPIKPSRLTSLFYPKNSIRQIPGVWTEIKFPVVGQPITLDQIEHRTLRKDFNEPRIHVALVCAAMGCPPLRNEPYTGEKLDVQLDDQTRRFLSNPQKFRIDPVNGRVYLSPIFKWFGSDFIKTYGTSEHMAGRSEPEKAVLDFVSKYVDEKIAQYLKTGEYGIEYLDYDWSLNERAEGKGETGKR